MRINRTVTITAGLTATIMALSACGTRLVEMQTASAGVQAVAHGASSQPKYLSPGDEREAGPTCPPGRKPDPTATAPHVEIVNGRLDPSSVPALAPVLGTDDCIAGWVRGADLYPDTSKMTPVEFGELAQRVNTEGYELVDESGNRVGVLLPERGVRLDTP